MNEDAGVLARLMRADQLEEAGRWEEAAWTRLRSGRWVEVVYSPGGGRVWARSWGAETPRLWVSPDEEGADIWLWEGGAWTVSSHLWTGEWSPWLDAPCPPRVRAVVEAACRLWTKTLVARGERL